MAENFDLKNIATPVNVVALVEALQESNYDEEKTEFLWHGFTEGFDIGYAGPADRKSTAKTFLLK